MSDLQYPMITITLGDKQFVAGLGDSPYTALYMPADTVMNVFHRLRENSWGERDVIGVIKAGLVGAGHSMHDAETIVKSNVTDRPLAQAAPAAMLILGAYLIGLDTAEEG
jgi:hypothetical protein